MSRQVENSGIPHRYSEGLLQKVDCCDGVTIIANKVYPSGTEDCRILVVKDCNGCVTEFFKGTLKICSVQDNKICENGKDFSDYRGAFTKDHVKLVGHINNCDNHFEVRSLSVFPKKGQTAQQLAEGIVLLICATYGAPPNFVEEGGQILPNVKCTLLYDRSLALVNPSRYQGGVLNNTSLVWTDDTFVVGDIASKYRARLISFRKDGTELLTGELVSPEIIFGTGFNFRPSSVDNSMKEQSISDWLNSLDVVKSVGVEFEDNAGVFKHVDGDQIDMFIVMEAFNTVSVAWEEWNARYGMSTYAGNYFISLAGAVVFDQQFANNQSECFPID